MVVLFCQVKAHLHHAGDGGEPVGKLRCLLLRQVFRHDLGGAVAFKLIGHDAQAPAGLGALRQVHGDVVFHLHPAHGHHGKQHQGDEKNEKQFVFFDNERGNALHKAGFFRHWRSLPS